MPFKFNPLTSQLDLVSGTTPGTMSNSFVTIATPAGTNPVASTPTDTLNLTSVDTSITITGNSGTDTVDFALSSAIQTQIAGKVDSSSIGIAGGVAPLDGAAKVPYANLPSAIMTYKGAWDASTNIPSLADGVGNNGDVYRASVAGTQDFGSGPQTFAIGDFVIYDGAIWQHSPAADGVSSVNGFTGAVSLSTTDIPEGSNLYYTDVRAQAAISATAPLVDTVGVFSIPVATDVVDGYLSSSDHAIFAAKQNALTFGDISTSTTGITVNSGTGSTVGPNVTLDIQTSTDSQPGLLSAADHTTFNAKQPAGNYITALTGDVVAAGPGSVSGTLAVAPNKRYVDFLNGSDAGTGSLVQPWKTLQYAYDSITPSINDPYVLYLSGGNNDSDASPITGKPNVSLIADYQIQISQPLTITSVLNTNDGVVFTNIIFVGAVTWIRNDFSIIGMTLNNCAFFNGPIFKQNGSGSASITSNNSVSVNMDLVTGGTGCFFTGHNFLGSTTFEDANTSAYYQIMGGYVGGAMSVAGGPFVYFSGVQFDVPFGASLTTSTTANGTPVLQTDSGSIPGTVSGPNSLLLQSFAQHESYTPAIGGNYSPSVSDVASALDQLAARTINSSNHVELITLLAGDITNKYVVLASAPTTPSLTRLTVVGGPEQSYATDFQILLSNHLDWNGLFLDGVLTTGDKLIISYN